MKRKRWLLIIPVVLGLCLCSVVGVLLGGDEAAEVAPTPSPMVTERSMATDEPTSSPEPTATAEPTNTPEPTVTAVPTATLTAEELLTRLATKALGSAPTLTKITGDIAVIEGDGLTLTEGLLLRSAVVSLRQLAPVVFDGMPDVNLLTLRIKAPFTDTYGKTSNEVALGFTVTRDLDDKVTWINLDGRRIDTLLSNEPGCSLYIHPALRDAWKKYLG